MPIKRSFLQLFSFRKKTKFDVDLLRQTGIRTQNAHLYQLAFRHRSKAHLENIESNERLEFLGDSVLGAIVASYLYKQYPEEDEGFLTKLRSKVVSRSMLNKLSAASGITELIDADKVKVDITKSVSGNALEAFIGAMYLDKGFEFTRMYLINKILLVHIDLDELKQLESDFKSKLVEWSQKHKKDIRFDSKSINLGNRGLGYEAILFVENEEKGRGQETSKKKAEQIASSIFLSTLEEN